MPAFRPPVFAASVASVENHFRGSAGRPVVYLVRDAHANESAQRNISSVLRQLASSKKADLVFLEGGWGDLSLASLAEGVSPADRRAVAERFLRKGLIQGADYADLVSETPLVLAGADDRKLYEEGLELYRSAAQNRERSLAWLDLAGRLHRFLKSRLYSSELQKLDTLRSAYRNDGNSFFEYLEALIGAAASNGIGLETSPAVEKAAALRVRETALDFSAATREQAEAVQSLEPSVREALLEAAREKKREAFFFGAPGHEADGGFFARLGEALGQRLSNYPALAAYLDYLRAARGLNAEELLVQTDVLEAAVFSAMARTEDERELVRAEKTIDVLRDLFSLKLESGKWELVRRDPAAFDPTELAARLNSKVLELGTRHEFSLFWSEEVGAAYGTACRFYENAAARDERFVETLLSGIAARGAQSAVFVAGGFHTGHVEELLAARGVSFVSVRPQVLSETNGKKYESLLLERSTIALQPAALMRNGQVRVQLAEAFEALRPSGARLASPITRRSGFYAITLPRLVEGELSKKDLLKKLSDREWLDEAMTKDNGERPINAIPQALAKVTLESDVKNPNKLKKMAWFHVDPVRWVSALPDFFNAYNWPDNLKYSVWVGGYTEKSENHFSSGKIFLITSHPSAAYAGHAEAQEEIPVHGARLAGDQTRPILRRLPPENFETSSEDGLPERANGYSTVSPVIQLWELLRVSQEELGKILADDPTRPIPLDTIRNYTSRRKPIPARLEENASRILLMETARTLKARREALGLSLADFGYLLRPRQPFSNNTMYYYETNSQSVPAEVLYRVNHFGKIRSPKILSIYRRLLGMTQAAAAEHIGIPRKTYIGYENADYSVPDEIVGMFTLVYMSEARKVLRAHMEELGANLNSYAQALGVDRDTIAGPLNKQRRVSLEILERSWGLVEKKRLDDRAELRNLRIGIEHSQKIFSGLLGIPKTTLAAYEAGKFSVIPAHILREARKIFEERAPLRFKQIRKSTLQSVKEFALFVGLDAKHPEAQVYNREAGASRLDPELLIEARQKAEQYAAGLVKASRIALGMSQERFGIFLRPEDPYLQETISEYESNKRKIERELLVSVEAAYDREAPLLLKKIRRRSLLSQGRFGEVLGLKHSDQTMLIYDMEKRKTRVPFQFLTDARAASLKYSAAQFKSHRLLRGWDIPQYAAQMEISNEKISSYESGNEEIPQEIMVKSRYAIRSEAASRYPSMEARRSAMLERLKQMNPMRPDGLWTYHELAMAVGIPGWDMRTDTQFIRDSGPRFLLRLAGKNGHTPGWLAVEELARIDRKLQQARHTASADNAPLPVDISSRELAWHSLYFPSGARLAAGSIDFKRQLEFLDDLVRYHRLHSGEEITARKIAASYGVLPKDYAKKSALIEKTRHQLARFKIYRLLDSKSGENNSNVYFFPDWLEPKTANDADMAPIRAIFNRSSYGEKDPILVREVIERVAELSGREPVQFTIKAAERRRFPDIPTRQISLKRQVERLRAMNQKLRRLLYKDDLTGLRNRLYFTRKMDFFIRRARAKNLPLALMVLDLDKFKAVNDTYGHLEGDTALAHVRRILRSTLRKSDRAIRYGGEEFVVVLPDTDLSGAKEVAAKIRSAFQEPVLLKTGTSLETEPVVLSASIGISELDLGSMVDGSESLFRRADREMYRVKHGSTEPVRTEIESAPGLSDKAFGARLAAQPNASKVRLTYEALDRLLHQTLVLKKSARRGGPRVVEDGAVEGGMISNYAVRLVVSSGTTARPFGPGDAKPPQLEVRFSLPAQDRGDAEAFSLAMRRLGAFKALFQSRFDDYYVSKFHDRSSGEFGFFALSYGARLAETGEAPAAVDQNFERIRKVLQEDLQGRLKDKWPDAFESFQNAWDIFKNSHLEDQAGLERRINETMAPFLSFVSRTSKAPQVVSALLDIAAKLNADDVFDEADAYLAIALRVTEKKQEAIPVQDFLRLRLEYLMTLYGVGANDEALQYSDESMEIVVDLQEALAASRRPRIKFGDSVWRAFRENSDKDVWLQTVLKENQYWKGSSLLQMGRYAEAYALLAAALRGNTKFLKPQLARIAYLAIEAAYRAAGQKEETAEMRKYLENSADMARIAAAYYDDLGLADMAHAAQAQKSMAVGGLETVNDNASAAYTETLLGLTVLFNFVAREHLVYGDFEALLNVDRLDALEPVLDSNFGDLWVELLEQHTATAIAAGMSERAEELLRLLGRIEPEADLSGMTARYSKLMQEEKVARSLNVKLGHDRLGRDLTAFYRGWTPKQKGDYTRESNKQFIRTRRGLLQNQFLEGAVPAAGWAVQFAAAREASAIADAAGFRPLETARRLYEILLDFQPLHTAVASGTGPEQLELEKGLDRFKGMLGGLPALTQPVRRIYADRSLTHDAALEKIRQIVSGARLATVSAQAATAMWHLLESNNKEALLRTFEAAVSDAQNEKLLLESLEIMGAAHPDSLERTKQILLESRKDNGESASIDRSERIVFTAYLNGVPEARLKTVLPEGTRRLIREKKKTGYRFTAFSDVLDLFQKPAAAGARPSGNVMTSSLLSNLRSKSLDLADLAANEGASPAAVPGVPAPAPIRRGKAAAYSVPDPIFGRKEPSSLDFETVETFHKTEDGVSFWDIAALIRQRERMKNHAAEEFADWEAQWTSLADSEFFNAVEQFAGHLSEELEDLPRLNRDIVLLTELVEAVPDGDYGWLKLRTHRFIDAQNKNVPSKPVWLRSLEVLEEEFQNHPTENARRGLAVQILYSLIADAAKARELPLGEFYRQNGFENSDAFLRYPSDPAWDWNRFAAVLQAYQAIAPAVSAPFETAGADQKAFDRLSQMPGKKSILDYARELYFWTSAEVKEKIRPYFDEDTGFLRIVQTIAVNGVIVAPEYWGRELTTGNPPSIVPAGEFWIHRLNQLTPHPAARGRIALETIVERINAGRSRKPILILKNASEVLAGIGVKPAEMYDGKPYYEDPDGGLVQRAYRQLVTPTQRGMIDSSVLTARINAALPKKSRTTKVNVVDAISRYGLIEAAQKEIGPDSPAVEKLRGKTYYNPALIALTVPFFKPPSSREYENAGRSLEKFNRLLEKAGMPAYKSSEGYMGLVVKHGFGEEPHRLQWRKAFYLKRGVPAALYRKINKEKTVQGVRPSGYIDSDVLAARVNAVLPAHLQTRRENVLYTVTNNNLLAVLQQRLGADHPATEEFGGRTYYDPLLTEVALPFFKSPEADGFLRSEAALAEFNRLLEKEGMPAYAATASMHELVKRAGLAKEPYFKIWSDWHYYAASVPAKLVKAVKAAAKHGVSPQGRIEIIALSRRVNKRLHRLDRVQAASLQSAIFSDGLTVVAQKKLGPERMATEIFRGKTYYDPVFIDILVDRFNSPRGRGYDGVRESMGKLNRLLRAAGRRTIAVPETYTKFAVEYGLTTETLRTKWGNGYFYAPSVPQMIFEKLEENIGGMITVNDAWALVNKGAPPSSRVSRNKIAVYASALSKEGKIAHRREPRENYYSKDLVALVKERYLPGPAKEPDSGARLAKEQAYVGLWISPGDVVRIEYRRSPASLGPLQARFYAYIAPNLQREAKLAHVFELPDTGRFEWQKEQGTPTEQIGRVELNGAEIISVVTTKNPPSASKTAEVSGARLARFFGELSAVVALPGKTLPLRLDQKTALFSFRSEAGDVVATAAGIGDIRIPRETARVSGEKPEDGLTVSNLRALEDSIDLKLDTVIPTNLPKKPVIVEIDAAFLEDASASAAADLVAALGRLLKLPEGENLAFEAAGPQAKTLSALDASGRVFSASRSAELAAAGAARVRLALPERRTASALNVPMSALSRGDVVPFRAIVRLAAATGRIDRQALPDWYLDAWGVLSGSRPDGARLASILDGTAPVERALAFALKPLARVSDFLAEQYSRLRLRMASAYSA